MARPNQRYVVTYEDGDNPGFGIATWTCFAWDSEHAEEKFYDDSSSDGFRVVSVDRPRNGWGKVDTSYDRK